MSADFKKELKNLLLVILFGVGLNIYVQSVIGDHRMGQLIGMILLSIPIAHILRRLDHD